MGNKSYLSKLKRLQGQVALVTGANSGIGKTVAEALASEGAKVAINYVTKKEKAEKLANQIKKQKGEAIIVKADVSDKSQVRKMFKKICQKFSKIDILVNNAGIQKDSSFVNMDLADWQKVLDINLTGSFLCAQEAAREFIKRGGKKNQPASAGKIIFISSVHQTIPWAKRCNYAAAKGGVSLLAKTIAQELASYKIRVNSVAPGAIKTPINERVWKDAKQRKKLLKLIPSNRLGAPEDVAKTVVWLASDESDYIQGETIYIDGGMKLYPGFATGG